MNATNNQTEAVVGGSSSHDLLAAAIEVCKCAADMGDRLRDLMASREHTLPIFLEKFGEKSVIRQATEAHHWMETLGNYFNGCDAVCEEDETWDSTFDKARKFFPLESEANR